MHKWEIKLILLIKDYWNWQTFKMLLQLIIWFSIELCYIECEIHMHDLFARYNFNNRNPFVWWTEVMWYCVCKLILKLYKIYSMSHSQLNVYLFSFWTQLWLLYAYNTVVVIAYFYVFFSLSLFGRHLKKSILVNFKISLRGSNIITNSRY